MRRKTLFVAPVIAITSAVAVLLTPGVARADHDRAHTCQQQAPLGGSARYDPRGPGPDDDVCFVTSAPFIINMPSGPPTIDTSDPVPVGEPVVVTEDIVTNCEQ